MASFLFRQKVPFIAHDFSSSETFWSHFSEAHIALSLQEKKTLFLELQKAPQQIHFQSEYLQGIQSADAIFVGQNWKNYPQNHPVLSQRKTDGVPFFTLMELYFACSPAPICGISGTNGKTTTTNWLRTILQSHVPCLQGGNDLFQPQCLHQLNTLQSNHYLVLEISNRQLEWLEASPYLGILTNIAEDHLEEHGSFEAYSEVKKKLVRHAKIAILNQEDPQLVALSTTLSADTYLFGFSPCRGLYVQEGTLYQNLGNKPVALLSVSEMKLNGKHHLLNGMAAALSALLLGVPTEKIIAGLKEFTGVRNRTQKIASVSGITYINDMACTSPHAALAALDYISEPIHLICGGDHKGADFSQINAKLLEKVRTIVLLPGTLGEVLQHPKIYPVTDLASAVQLATQFAQSGETVLLSPMACGFFSRFVRGKNSFSQLVKSLWRETPSSPRNYSHSIGTTS
ncbi:MAG: UDP-N-acetylmuramoyl-L-alanine--D-glutamate ligase [Planctomycetota bacterium]